MIVKLCSLKQWTACLWIKHLYEIMVWKRNVQTKTVHGNYFSACMRMYIFVCAKLKVWLPLGAIFALAIFTCATPSGVDMQFQHFRSGPLSLLSLAHHHHTTLRKIIIPFRLKKYQKLLFLHRHMYTMTYKFN